MVGGFPCHTSVSSPMLCKDLSITPGMLDPATAQALSSLMASEADKKAVAMAAVGMVPEAAAAAMAKALAARQW